MVCLPRPLPVLRRLCSFPPLPEATGRGFLLTFEMGGGHTPLPLPLSYHTTPLDFRGDKPRPDRMPADQRDSLLYPIFLDSLRDFYCWVFVTSIFLLELHTSIETSISICSLASGLITRRIGPSSPLSKSSFIYFILGVLMMMITDLVPPSASLPASPKSVIVKKI